MTDKNFHPIFKKKNLVYNSEKLYSNVKDPWSLVRLDQKNFTFKKNVILNLCNFSKILKKRKKLKILEIGCGFPVNLSYLYLNKFDVHGTDNSETCIRKSKIKYPYLKKRLHLSEFLNFKLYKKINPDVIILSDITWYVLDELKSFLKWYKGYKKNIYLIHCLQTYGDKQKYGKNYFTDLEDMKKFFKLKYIVTGKFAYYKEDYQTFFLASR